MSILAKIRDAISNIVSKDDEECSAIERMSPSEFVKAAEPLRIGREVPKALILFEYSCPLVRKAVWEIKFRGNRRIAKIIAELLYDELVEKLSEEKLWGRPSAADGRPILLPIPISSKRRRERGWNQCEIIAEELQKLDGGKNFELCKNILVKNKNTSDQVGKGRSARLKNLENSFSVKNENAVRDRFVIVLDDVITTGATIEEARRVLRSLGVAEQNILFLAIAH